jgi:hypothetical protein
MLETLFSKDFCFSVSDSTVYVNQGTARIGNTILPFRGDTIPFQSIVDFGDQTNVYQYSALVLQNFNSYADLTAVVSLPADSTRRLSYPEFIPDTSNTYSPVFPIGLFLFHTPDGSSINLMTSQRIVC